MGQGGKRAFGGTFWGFGIVVGITLGVLEVRAEGAKLDGEVGRMEHGLERALRIVICEGSTTRRNGMATLGLDDGDPLILDVV